MCAGGGSEEPTDEPDEPTRIPLLSLVATAVSDVFSLVSTVVYQSVGLFFGIGLLLNLSGFGYRLNWEGFVPSVEVKPIEEMRREIRYERYYGKEFMAEDL